ncbi:hypothetical protein EJ377_15700 [Chryseobacterium arthrosphaerae]|uniref:Uncharacterized protein n=1 Tax=Chryseobacterium arthrosphaerae TaxID=651561 RepID=A0A3S0Q3X8_9FLAO|nr:hypothetical protein EJ377_15700 [Chryseobacterium arthrosphaerae]
MNTEADNDAWDYIADEYYHCLSSDMSMRYSYHNRQWFESPCKAYLFKPGISMVQTALESTIGILNRCGNSSMILISWKKSFRNFRPH